MKLYSLAVLFVLAAGCGTSTTTGADASNLDQQSALTVTGTIRFPAGTSAPATWQTAPASGVVTVRDTTEQDGPSTELARVTFTAKDASPVPFTVPVEGIVANRTYTVFVHVDADGDGQTSNGDFITTQSYPVLTAGHGNTVDVEVKPVGGVAVSGKILLAGETTSLMYPFTGVVTVQDVTLQDTAAVEVGRQTVTVTGPGPIAFSVPVSGIQSKSTYAVQVKLDVDGDGQLSDGDFVTTETVPVLTQGHGSTVDVNVHRI